MLSKIDVNFIFYVCASCDLPFVRDFSQVVSPCLNKSLSVLSIVNPYLFKIRGLTKLRSSVA